MNAAFVLMTAALMSGDTPAPAPAHGTVITSDCGGSCGSGCGYVDDCCCERESFLDRIRRRCSGLFNRGGCCNTGCDTCTTYTTDCCDTCDTGCGCGGRMGLFSRLRGMFRRSSCCETDCCGSYGGCANGSCGGGAVIGTTPATMPKVGEEIPIPPPENGGAKKMPAGDDGGAKPAPKGDGAAGEPPVANDQIQINNPVTNPVPVNDPDLNIVPPVPSIPGNNLNRKNAF